MDAFSLFLRESTQAAKWKWKENQRQEDCSRQPHHAQPTGCGAAAEAGAAAPAIRVGQPNALNSYLARYLPADTGDAFPAVSVLLEVVLVCIEMRVAPSVSLGLTCTSCLHASGGAEESKGTAHSFCLSSGIDRLWEVSGAPSSLCRAFSLLACLLPFKNKNPLHEKIMLIIIILYELT